MKYRVKSTPEQEELARRWLEQPLPEDSEAFEQMVRDVDAIQAVPGALYTLYVDEITPEMEPKE